MTMSYRGYGFAKQTLCFLRLGALVKQTHRQSLFAEDCRRVPLGCLHPQHYAEEVFVLVTLGPATLLCTDPLRQDHPVGPGYTCYPQAKRQQEKARRQRAEQQQEQRHQRQAPATAQAEAHA